MTMYVFAYLGALEYASRDSGVSFIAHISGYIDLMQEKCDFRNENLPFFSQILNN